MTHDGRDLRNSLRAFDAIPRRSDALEQCKSKQKNVHT